MEQIFFSESVNISYDTANVYINNLQVSEDEKSGMSSESYAYQKMRQTYQDIASKQYENVIVLSGAGTSVGIGANGKTGKSMAELWTEVVRQIGFDTLKKFAKSVKFTSIKEDYTDLEQLLSHAMLAEAYSPRASVAKFISRIEAIIRENCSLDLPDNAPHIGFIRKITSRKLKYSRAKIFTLNYDLLFEQAASKGGYVVIDGFSFNMPRIFSGVNFDYDIVTRSTNRAISEENFSPKVFHLYKIHGSLDWDRITNKNEDSEIFVKTDSPNSPVMIYPSSRKFESSYEQPYFEMISRFQQELRGKNTLLIVIGFSFYDKHIKAMIDESLNVNPSITLMVICPDVKNNAKYKDLKRKAGYMKNIYLVCETFENFAKYFPYSEIYDYTEGGSRKIESI